MKVLLVHGVGHEDPNPAWPAEWEKAISDGLKHYNYTGPIQFVPEPPVTYDDLFEQNPEPTTEYLQAMYDLLKAWMLCVLMALSSAIARRYSGPELKATFTFMPQPEYPYKLRFMQHIGGSGMFRMIVDERGKVTAVTALQSMGHSELDAEAIKGLMRWKAQAGQKREGDIPVTFIPAKGNL